MDDLCRGGVALHSGGTGQLARRVCQLDQRSRAGHHCHRQEGSRDRGQHEREEAPGTDGGYALRMLSDEDVEEHDRYPRQLGDILRVRSSEGSRRSVRECSRFQDAGN